MSHRRVSYFGLPSSIPTLWQSARAPTLSYRVKENSAPLLSEEKWDAWWEDYIELAFCLLEIEFRWSEAAPFGEGPKHPEDTVELLIIQAWRTAEQGDLLGIVFGKVEEGNLALITDELLVFLTQLVDDLPLDILSHSDKQPGTHVLSQTLEPHLVWSTCTEIDEDNCLYPSQVLYLEIDITDLTFWDPIVRQNAARDEEIGGADEEEEEEEPSSEERDDPDYVPKSEAGIADESSQPRDEEEEEGNEQAESEARDSGGKESGQERNREREFCRRGNAQTGGAWDMAKKERKLSDGKGPSVNKLAEGDGGGRKEKRGDGGLKVKTKKVEEDKQGARETKTKESGIGGESDVRDAMGSTGKRREEKEVKEGKEGKAKKEKKERKGKEDDKHKKEASSVSPKKRKQRPEKQEDEDGDGDLRKKKVKIERKEGKLRFKTSSGAYGRGAWRKNDGYGDEAEKGEEVMPPPTDRSKCKGKKSDMQVIVDATGKKTYKCDGCGRLLSSYFQLRRHKWKINSWRRKVGLPPLQGDDDEEDKGKGSADTKKTKKKEAKRFKRDGKPQLKRTSVCRAWQKGECKYGADKCRFRHEVDSAGKSAGKGKKASLAGKGEKAQPEFRLQKEEPLLPRQDSMKRGKTAKKVRLLKKSNKPKKLSKKTNAGGKG
ncbi:hypothetical protein CBR_g954 [Chara braunii]|uniref:C3H1-type domain-containing protein n=1 Tax=Chara braunii TaxID=69332 RepID=A0A388KD06_CHABU|nr:hypothetical protein CBR_g954 [Chara braunii]|eukprot:GBG67833.1 hypothetical protein CBR_g954 [Chara braunii]